MRRLALLIAILVSQFAGAQLPPPPPEDDFPKPVVPNSEKEDRERKSKDVIEPDRKGVKPPMPVIPPTPEPTLPDEP